MAVDLNRPAGSLVALVHHQGSLNNVLLKVVQAGERRQVQLVEELRVETLARHAAERRAEAAEAEVKELKAKLAARDEPLARSA